MLDWLLYLLHALFWGCFALARSLTRRRAPAPTPGPATSGPERVAPWSRSLLLVHTAAFGVMYFGMGNTIIPGRVADMFPGQRLLGTLVIGVGGAFAAAAMLHFTSWRYRAALAEGHQLATGGPFALVRHPIYLALDLLALGTALWTPTPFTWAGFVLMVIGSELRGRAEERLLLEGFGEAYRSYAARTRRFLPGIY